MLSLTLLAALSFVPTAAVVATWDYAEVTIKSTPLAGNCFRDVSLTATLTLPNGEQKRIDGFCDAADGSLFRARFLPVTTGLHRYELRFQSPAAPPRTFQGSFTAMPSRRRGLVERHPDHPFHFRWRGTNEPYYWNGLTTYALMGWQDESYIKKIIDRAANHNVNRLRVTLLGPRVEDASRWYEPVKPSAQFRFLFGPWVAAEPDNVKNPRWDVTRFDTAFWQKYERLVRVARERDVVISVIFFLDGQDEGADPFGKAGMFSEDQLRYYRYANARLGAFSNVSWDVTNEWHLFRSAWWVERMGNYLRSLDAYGHLLSCHGRGDFPWMVSPWPDMSLFQIWDESGGYQPMLDRRIAQQKTGRPIPQVNEEYGYEDHYPVKWGGNRRAPSRNADNRRRLAWQIAMAGAYQTTGERADPSGGWINGGFDDTMQLLPAQSHLVDFFTSIPYYGLEPSPSLVKGPALLLAEIGKQYVAWFSRHEAATIELSAGSWQYRWYNSATGQWAAPATPFQTAESTQWSSPPPPWRNDAVLYINTRR
jgi:hypothetical protein